MEIQTYRLSKVARDFNVGIDTLIQCLKNNGFEIDGDNINTKITPEQFDVLKKTFRPEAESLDNSTVKQEVFIAEKDVMAKTDLDKNRLRKPANHYNHKYSFKAQQIDSFKKKTEEEIIQYLFSFWKLEGDITPDCSFKVIASYKKVGKDKNGNDYGFFEDIRSLNGDILYYPFRLGKIMIYTPHSDFFEKETLWQINVKLNKEKYRQDNPFSLQLADRVVEKIKNSFVNRLENEKLVRKIFDETGATKRDAKIMANALISIMGDLYSEGDERFIFELLQNADDQPQDNQHLVSVKLNALYDYLIFTHSGKPFSKEDVESISSIGDSTKKNDSQKTGYKGIGFKSVFSGADTVFINSGAFSFAFDKYSPLYKGEDYMDEIPWQLKPIWEEKYRLPDEVSSDSDYFDYPVGIALKIGNEKINTYKAQIQELFTEPRFMLFLRHIGDINYCSLDGTNISIHKDVLCDEIVTISSNDNVSMWLVTDYDFDIPTDIHEQMQNEKLVPNKLKNAQRSKISFATLIHDSSISSISNSTLFSYLPTKVNEFHFPFLVNADFLTTASRESIHNKNIWNQFLFSQIGKLIVQWAKHLSNYIGYLNFLPYNLLPESNPLSEYFNSSYKSALDTEAFILDHVGTLSKQDEIILDQSGLSVIVGQELFCKIIKTDKCLPSDNVDISTLKNGLFDKIEKIDFDKVLRSLINNIDFCDWFISATDNQKGTFFIWIKMIKDNGFEPNEGLLDNIISRLPLFKFDEEYKSHREIMSSINCFITTDHISPIKDILKKLNISCSDNILNDSHPLYNYIKAQSDVDLFKSIKFRDFSTLSIDERKTLFISLANFNDIGDVKLKEIPLFKNMNGAFKPLGTMSAYKDNFDQWLYPYVLCKDDSFEELLKYTIPEEQFFDEIIWKHKEEHTGTLSEFKNKYNWTDEKYTKQLIIRYKATSKFQELLPIVEKSSQEIQVFYLQSIIRIDLSHESKYSKDSYEYRVLQLAVSAFEDPSIFSSKVYFDGKCINSFSITDDVICDFVQQGENKKVKLSLSKLLPLYHNESDSIITVKNLFESKKDLDKFFNAKSKPLNEVYRELNQYLQIPDSAYSKWTVNSNAYQYLFITYYRRQKKSWYGLYIPEIDLDKESEVFINDLLDFLYVNNIHINDSPFTYHIKKYFEGKYFYSDYILNKERLLPSIEKWASEDKKKRYLMSNGVLSSNALSIQFRKLFIDDQPISFIENLSDKDIRTGIEYIITYNLSKPFIGTNQETILLQLEKRKTIKLIDQLDKQQTKNKSVELATQEYNKWKNEQHPSIFILTGCFPHHIVYNDITLLSYSDKNKYHYYDMDTNRLFLSDSRRIEDILFEIAKNGKCHISLDDYKSLCLEGKVTITKDDIVQKDKTIQSLSEENKKKDEIIEQYRAKYGDLEKPQSEIIMEEEENSPSPTTTNITTIKLGNPSSIGKSSQFEAQLEAQQRLLQEFPEWTFPDNYGECDESGEPYNYTTFEVVDENNKIIPLVLKSYKRQNEPFKINPEEWDYLIKKNADLLIYTGADIKRIFVKDLIMNQSNIAITFSTENLDIEERIEAFADSLHYFGELHFDFDSFNISKKAESVADVYKKNKRAEYVNNNTEDDI